MGSVSVPTLFNWRWTELNLALLQPERVLKNTLSALHSALKAAMFESCTRGSYGGEEAGRRAGRVRGGGRWETVRAGDRNCYVTAAAAHVSNVSAARTLAASIGWNSARGSPLRIISITLQYSKTQNAKSLAWLMHRMYEYKHSWDLSIARKINIINDVLTSCAHVVALALTWRFLFSHGRRVQATRFRVGEKDIWVRHQML